MRIAATGLKHLPNTAQAAAEFRFSLSSALFYSAFTANLANALQPETRYTIYAYWFHTQASVGKHIHAEYGYPFISRGHRGDIYDHQSPINYLPGRTEILRSLDHLYAVSDQGRDYLRSRYPSYAERIDTARLGVSAARNAGNPSLKPHKVVSCSRVVPVKRLPLLIDAVAELQARGIELHWVHLGGGSPEATEELSRYAERHLTPDSYTLAGDLSNTELRDWYASNPATVFVNVSASEGVPVSIMEALAQGLPVIATDVGGTSELIKTETGMFGGLLTANPTASEVADRIEALFSLTDDAFTAAVQGSVSHWQGAWSSDTNFRAFAALLERSAR
nr:glycosyltransferase [Leucobacter chinensis]